LYYFACHWKTHHRYHRFSRRATPSPGRFVFKNVQLQFTLLFAQVHAANTFSSVSSRIKAGFDAGERGTKERRNEGRYISVFLLFYNAALVG
jgi:hypothetical protein